MLTGGLGLVGTVLSDLSGRSLLHGTLLILNSSSVSLVVTVLLASLGDGSGGSGTLDKARWWSTGLVGTFGMTLDLNGVVVDKLDFDVLLFNAGELAVKLVAVADFLDIELGAEGFHSVTLTVGASDVALALLRIGVEVVEEANERVEGRCLGGEAWEVVEGRHVASRFERQRLV